MYIKFYYVPTHTHTHTQKKKKEQHTTAANKGRRKTSKKKTKG